MNIYQFLYVFCIFFVILLLFPSSKLLLIADRIVSHAGRPRLYGVHAQNRASDRTEENSARSDKGVLEQQNWQICRPKTGQILQCLGRFHADYEREPS